MRPSDPLQARLIELCTPDIEYATLLIERTQSESLRLKQGRLDPPSLSDDSGLQVIGFFAMAHTHRHTDTQTDGHRD